MRECVVVVNARGETAQSIGLAQFGGSSVFRLQKKCLRKIHSCLEKREKGEETNKTKRKKARKERKRGKRGKRECVRLSERARE